MDTKNLSIATLFITAVILLAANLMVVQPSAVASAALKDRDYALVSGRSAQGGDSIYVIDNRSGAIALFAWDPSRRALVVKDVRPIAEAFEQ